MKTTIKKRRFTYQISGVHNDFLSVKKRKNGKSYYEKWMEENRKKNEALEAKANQEENLRNFLKTNFPPVEMLKPKNDVKYEKRCKERIERLSETEEFWPYTYGRSSDWGGRLVKITLSPHYTRYYFKHWAVHESYTYDENGNRIIKKFFYLDEATYGANKLLGCATGDVIHVYDQKTGKLGRIVACQVLVDNKLYYVDLEYLTKL